MTGTAKHYGFNRTKKIIVAFVTLLATIMLFVPITGTNAYAESADTRDLNTALLPYAQELEKINSELGTDFAFIVGDGFSDDQFNCLVDFYQQMTLEEFHDYIYKMHKNNINTQNDFDIDIELIEEENSPCDIELFSDSPVSNITYKYYYNYSKNLNCLSISFEVMFGGGRAIFVTAIDKSCTWGIDDYTDFYRPYSNARCMYSSDQSTVRVLFYCERVVNGVVDQSDHKTFRVTFEAAGGDVYEN